MAFTTLDDVITQTRVLLQDEDTEGYRYSTTSIYQALNEALLESARMRPDFFRGIAVPQYSSANSADDINYPNVFIPALIDYVCGRVQLRDDEASTDQRAGVLITSFRRLLGTAL